MIYLGSIICLLSLAAATVYAADGSTLSLCLALLLLAIGAGLAIPAAVATEKEEKQ